MIAGKVPEPASLVYAGIEKNRQDVVGVVHVGEATLLKRVKEFALTASSNLTAESFEKQVVQLQEQHKKSSQQLAMKSTAPSEDGAAQVGCLHMSKYGQQTPASPCRRSS